MKIQHLVAMALLVAAFAACKRSDAYSKLAVMESYPEFGTTAALCAKSSSAQVARVAKVNFGEGVVVTTLTADVCAGMRKKRRPAAALALADAAKRPPLVILSFQYGKSEGDQPVRIGQGMSSRQFESIGYRVLDLSNKTPAEIQEAVKADREANPADYSKEAIIPVVTGGHGHIATIDGKTQHVMVASDGDGPDAKPRVTATLEDVIKPLALATGAVDADGPKLSAFVSSCISGEAVDDVTNDEALKANGNVQVVASAGKDQYSQGVGRGIEQGLKAYLAAAVPGSDAAKAADENQDGVITSDEFADQVNTDNGGMSYLKPETTLIPNDADPTNPNPEIKIDGFPEQLAKEGDVKAVTYYATRQDITTETATNKANGNEVPAKNFPLFPQVEPQGQGILPEFDPAPSPEQVVEDAKQMAADDRQKGYDAQVVEKQPDLPEPLDNPVRAGQDEPQGEAPEETQEAAPADDPSAL